MVPISDRFELLPHFLHERVRDLQRLFAKLAHFPHQALGYHHVKRGRDKEWFRYRTGSSSFRTSCTSVSGTSKDSLQNWHIFRTKRWATTTLSVDEIRNGSDIGPVRAPSALLARACQGPPKTLCKTGTFSAPSAGLPPR